MSQQVLTECSTDDIAYGNPSLEQISLMSKQTMLDGLFDELSKIFPPANSSEITQKELNDLVVYTSQLANDEELKRYFWYDGSLLAYLESIFTDVDFDVKEALQTAQNVLDDINPLIMRLKYFFNRARPNQLAYYYKLKLFPFDSISSNSPSYPSAHAYQAKVVAEVLGNKYPRYYQSFKSLSDDIALSRMSMGLHYQSDIDMGIYAAEEVLNVKEFKKKYRL
jgi:hypothetical protein